MTNAFELSVIIPTLGGSKLLPELLTSIEQQKANFKFEVILIDNSLNPEVLVRLQALVLKSRMSVKVITIQLQGVNFARNAGIAESQSDLLLFLDDDCWFSDRLLLAKHHQFHAKYPNYFAIGGRYALDTKAGFIDSCYHEIQMKWLNEGVTNATTGQALYLIGGHFSLKKNILTSCRIQFDPNIKYGGSEVSLFLQSNKLGLLSKLENIYVIHSPELTMFKVLKKLFRQGLGKAYLENTYVEVQSKNNNTTKLPFLTELFINFLKNAFWFGYFKGKKQPHRFFTFCVSNCLAKINQKRYDLISKVDRNK